MKALFRKKSVSCEDFGLKKCLGAFDLTLLGIGAIIGTGIFVLTGVAAATQAGPAVVLSFVVAGIACTFAALAYAELASSVGGCGSAYGYSYAAFGELIAWIIGWDLVLEYGVAVAAVANGWSGYFNNALSAIGWGLPEALTKGPFNALAAVRELFRARGTDIAALIVEPVAGNMNCATAASISAGRPMDVCRSQVWNASSTTR